MRRAHRSPRWLWVLGGLAVGLAAGAVAGLLVRHREPPPPAVIDGDIDRDVDGLR